VNCESIPTPPVKPSETQLNPFNPFKSPVKTGRVGVRSPDGVGMGWDFRPEPSLSNQQLERKKKRKKSVKK